MKIQSGCGVAFGIAWFLFLLLPEPSTCFGQGSLTPPGAPGPTMKTLQQIEPRVPIESLSGSVAKYDITRPGSYYLSSNLVAGADQSAISILTNNVTVDLNGFTVFAATNRSGLISNVGGARNLRVFGGKVVNCASGVEFGSFGTISDCIVEDLDIDCSPGLSFRYGIRVNDRSVVRRCKVSGADGNSSYGIVVGAASVVEGCRVRGCSAGILTDSKSRVEGCEVEDCLVSEGILVLNSCVVRNNIVTGCHGGIRVDSNSFVTDNLAHNSVTNGSGIYCAGSNNRIERNATHFNGQGIQTASSTTNFVVQNVAHGNSLANFNFIGAVVAGPTVTTVDTTTNHPWANFGY